MSLPCSQVFREASKVAPELMVPAAAAQRSSAGRAAGDAADGQGAARLSTSRATAVGSRSDQRAAAAGAQGEFPSRLGDGDALSGDERQASQSLSGGAGRGGLQVGGVHFSTLGVAVIAAGLAFGIAAAVIYALGWQVGVDSAMVQPKARWMSIGALGIGFALLAGIKSFRWKHS